ncbi:MFS general substrate transporter [Suillus variegatus]|nr:MFS general substrate transporter [Suillus variegatus]
MPASNSQTEASPPDGGFRAWGTVFGCFLMQFCGFGYISSFGVYQDYYTRVYMTNYPPSAISWIGALTSFLAVIVTLISGPLYDRGWFYRLMIVGSLLQSLSLFALSFTKPGQFYLALMVQGVISGFGMGLTYAPSIAVVSQHFSSRKRTLVMSLVTSGTPLGSMIHPIMLNNLLNGTVGFAKGVRASAGFVSALLLIACLSVRTRELPAPTVGYTVVARKCSREVLFILMTVGSTLFQTGFYFPLFYLQLDSTKHGIDVNFSFYSLVIMNAACFIGRCMTGTIAAYAGVLNSTIASTVACSAIIISMIALSDMASVVVLGLAYGYFSGVCMLSRWIPLVAVLTPDLSELGARMGICFAFTAFGGLLGGPISGALLGSQYKWWIASLFTGVSSSHCFCACTISMLKFTSSWSPLSEV